MINAITWLVVALLACIGFVQLAGYFAIRSARRGGQAFRVFPIGGQGEKPQRQMAFFYTCVQWEANPSGQTNILYNAGLDEAGSRECAQLAKESGALFANSPEELADLLGGQGR